MFSHLPGRDLLHVKLVSKHFNSLVPVVYSFRGRNNLDKVILIQQWWKDFGKKRLDACAEQFDTRKLVVDECLMITETVFGTDFEKGGGENGCEKQPMGIFYEITLTIRIPIDEEKIDQ
mgnify:CR=1 FL=1